MGTADLRRTAEVLSAPLRSLGSKVVDPDRKIRNERRAFGWPQRIMVLVVATFGALFVFGSTASSSPSTPQQSAAGAWINQPMVSAAPTPGSVEAVLSSNPKAADRFCYSLLRAGSDASPVTDPTGVITKACDYVQRAQLLPNVTSVSAGCEYLTFCRWYGATLLPTDTPSLRAIASSDDSSSDSSSSPNGDSNQPKTSSFLPIIAAGFGSIFLSISSTLMYLVGLVVLYAISFQPLKDGIYFADWVFASVGTRLTGQSGSSTSRVTFLAAIFLVIFGLGLWGFLRKGDVTGAIKKIVYGVAVVGIVGIMALGASKNHSSVLEATGSGAEASNVGIADQQRTGAASGAQAFTVPDGTGTEPSDWGVLSPGWAYSVANEYGVNTLIDVTTGLGTDITGALSAVTNDDYTGCSQYVGGMHSAFMSTGLAKNMGKAAAESAVTYSSLSNQLYFNLYQLAAIGDSRGSTNAICRLLESQTTQSPADQAMISRIAGLYGNFLGTGGLGVAGATEVGQTNGPANDFVASSDWEDAQSTGQGGGTGPNYDAGDATVPPVAVPYLLFDPGSDRGSNRAASMFWAACDWSANGGPSQGGTTPGDPVLSADWVGVRQSAAGDFVNDNEGAYLTPQNCVEYLKYYSDSSGFLGLGSSTASGAVARSAFAYAEVDAGCFFGIINPLGICGEDLSNWNRFPQGSGAQDYYSHLLGRESFGAMVIAIVAAIVAWQIAKTVSPLAIGAILLGVVAAVAIGFLPILLLGMLILGAKVRSLAMSTLKMIASALLVSVVVVVMFTMLMVIAKMFLSFARALTGDASTLVRTLAAAGATIASFAVFRMIAKSIFGANFANMRSTATSLARWGTAPLAKHFGVAAIGPLDSEFWNASTYEARQSSPFRRRARQLRNRIVGNAGGYSARGTSARSDDDVLTNRTDPRMQQEILQKQDRLGVLNAKLGTKEGLTPEETKERDGLARDLAATRTRRGPVTKDQKRLEALNRKVTKGLPLTSDEQRERQNLSRKIASEGLGYGATAQPEYQGPSNPVTRGLAAVGGAVVAAGDGVTAAAKGVYKVTKPARWAASKTGTWYGDHVAASAAGGAIADAYTGFRAAGAGGGAAVMGAVFGRMPKNIDPSKLGAGAVDRLSTISNRRNGGAPAPGFIGGDTVSGDQARSMIDALTPMRPNVSGDDPASSARRRAMGMPTETAGVPGSGSPRVPIPGMPIPSGAPGSSTGLPGSRPQSGSPTPGALAAGVPMPAGQAAEAFTMAALRSGSSVGVKDAADRMQQSQQRQNLYSTSAGRDVERNATVASMIPPFAAGAMLPPTNAAAADMKDALAGRQPGSGRALQDLGYEGAQNPLFRAPAQNLPEWVRSTQSGSSADDVSSVDSGAGTRPAALPTMMLAPSTDLPGFRRLSANSPSVEGTFATSGEIETQRAREQVISRVLDPLHRSDGAFLSGAALAGNDIGVIPGGVGVSKDVQSGWDSLNGWVSKDINRLQQDPSEWPEERRQQLYQMRDAVSNTLGSSTESTLQRSPALQQMQAVAASGGRIPMPDLITVPDSFYDDSGVQGQQPWRGRLVPSVEEQSFNSGVPLNQPNEDLARLKPQMHHFSSLGEYQDAHDQWQRAASRQIIDRRAAENSNGSGDIPAGTNDGSSLESRRGDAFGGGSFDGEDARQASARDIMARFDRGQERQAERERQSAEGAQHTPPVEPPRGSDSRLDSIGLGEDANDRQSGDAFRAVPAPPMPENFDSPQAYERAYDGWHDRSFDGWMNQITDRRAREDAAAHGVEMPDVTDSQLLGVPAPRQADYATDTDWSTAYNEWREVNNTRDRQDMPGSQVGEIRSDLDYSEEGRRSRAQEMMERFDRGLERQGELQTDFAARVRQQPQFQPEVEQPVVSPQQEGGFAGSPGPSYERYSDPQQWEQANRSWAADNIYSDDVVGSQDSPRPIEATSPRDEVGYQPEPRQSYGLPSQPVGYDQQEPQQTRFQEEAPREFTRSGDGVEGPRFLQAENAPSAGQDARVSPSEPLDPRFAPSGEIPLTPARNVGPGRVSMTPAMEERSRDPLAAASRETPPAAEQTRQRGPASGFLGRNSTLDSMLMNVLGRNSRRGSETDDRG